MAAFHSKMDNSYALKKLDEIYTKIPELSSQSAHAAKLIKFELEPLLEANAALRFEFKTFPVEDLVSQSEDSGLASAFFNVREVLAEPAVAYDKNRLYPLSLGNDFRKVLRFLSKKMRALDASEEGGEKRKGIKKRGARVLYRGNRNYEYKNEKYRQNNWNFARLCGFVYSRCRLVGDKITVAEVYHFMNPSSDYMVEKQKNWKRIYDLVTTANAWAERNGLPELMQCKTEYIVRRGIG